MTSPSPLQALLARAATANPDPRDRDAAYRELTRLLTIMVRTSMSPKLRRARESMDVCQSVAKSFVDDMQGGRLAFENEAALVGYLQKVVRNKLADLSRHDGAAKRGAWVPPSTIGRHDEDDRALDPAAGGPGPGSLVAEVELKDGRLRDLMAGMDDGDRHLVELRLKGLEWGVVAEHLGISEAAARKRWSRLQGELAAKAGNE